jgi:hypothetical protein
MRSAYPGSTAHELARRHSTEASLEAICTGGAVVDKSITLIVSQCPPRTDLIPAACARLMLLTSFAVLWYGWVSGQVNIDPCGRQEQSDVGVELVNSWRVCFGSNSLQKGRRRLYSI